MRGRLIVGNFGGDRKSFRTAWADFKDKFEKLDENQKDNPRIQSFIFQIRLRVKKFEKAKDNESEKEEVNRVKLVELLSETDKYLNTIYWLLYDYEKHQAKELMADFLMVTEALSRPLSPSDLKELPKYSPDEINRNEFTFD